MLYYSNRKWSFSRPILCDSRNLCVISIFRGQDFRSLRKPVKGTETLARLRKSLLFFYFQRVKIDSRWNSWVAKANNPASRISNPTAIHRMMRSLTNIKPVDCPTNNPISGSTKMAEICSATRGSVTREEIITARLTPARANKGPTTKIALSHKGSNNLANTPGLTAEFHPQRRTNLVVQPPETIPRN